MRIFTEEELKGEKWKPLYSFEEYCEASTLGRIKTLDREVADKRGRTKLLKGRILTLGYYSNGYEQFSICVNGKRFTAIVHRLIALTFITNTFNKAQVNHKNGIRDDNKIINLEWTTHSENIQHSFKVLNRKPKDNIGSKNSNATLSEEKVLEIRRLYKEGDKNQKELSEIYNVNKPAIWKIVNNYNWKHILKKES